jgi:hypothetical protein
LGVVWFGQQVRDPKRFELQIASMLAVSRGRDNRGFRLHSFNGANQRYAIDMWQPDVAQHALTEFISWAK